MWFWKRTNRLRGEVRDLHRHVDAVAASLEELRAEIKARELLESFEVYECGCGRSGFPVLSRKECFSIKGCLFVNSAIIRCPKCDRTVGPYPTAGRAVEKWNTMAQAKEGDSDE